MNDLPLDVDTLIKQHRSGVPLKYVYFWGHRPRPDSSIDKSCFSQWWQSPFVVDGVTYATAEHYMMAQKALLFNDQSSFDKIIMASHPKQAKDLGRGVSGFDDKVWNAHRFNIVVNGNIAKFEQSEALKYFLLGTSSRILVEASPVDKIWGVGLAKDDERILDPAKWQGPNLLGFALMVVRDRLREAKV